MNPAMLKDRENDDKLQRGPGNHRTLIDYFWDGYVKGLHWVNAARKRGSSTQHLVELRLGPPTTAINSREAEEGRRVSEPVPPLKVEDYTSEPPSGTSCLENTTRDLITNQLTHPGITEAGVLKAYLEDIQPYIVHRDDDLQQENHLPGRGLAVEANVPGVVQDIIIPSPAGVNKYNSATHGPVRRPRNNFLQISGQKKSCIFKPYGASKMNVIRKKIEQLHKKDGTGAGRSMYNRIKNPIKCGIRSGRVGTMSVNSLGSKLENAIDASTRLISRTTFKPSSEKDTLEPLTTTVENSTIETINGITSTICYQEPTSSRNVATLNCLTPILEHQSCNLKENSPSFYIKGIPPPPPSEMNPEERETLDVCPEIEVTSTVIKVGNPAELTLLRSTRSSSRTNETPISSEEDFRQSQEENALPTRVLLQSKQKTGSRKGRSAITIYQHITLLCNKEFKCNICSKTFKTKAHIKYHEFCDTNAEKPYDCAECGKKFIAKAHFEYHVRTHTGARPYTCTECGKSFIASSKLTRHSKTHTQEKPFKCTSCGKAFAANQTLKSHMLIHTGERPFPCDLCSKRFRCKTNLKQHALTHTGERPFHCEICMKTFSFKWSLTMHIRSHSKARPFVCDHDRCGIGFSNLKDLKRHKGIHSSECPFVCQLCSTAFKRKDNRDRHVRNYCRANQQPTSGKSN